MKPLGSKQSRKLPSIDEEIDFLSDADVLNRGDEDELINPHGLDSACVETEEDKQRRRDVLNCFFSSQRV